MPQCEGTPLLRQTGRALDAREYDAITPPPECDEKGEEERHDSMLPPLRSRTTRCQHFWSDPAMLLTLGFALVISVGLFSTSKTMVALEHQTQQQQSYQRTTNVNLGATGGSGGEDRAPAGSSGSLVAGGDPQRTGDVLDGSHLEPDSEWHGLGQASIADGGGEPGATGAGERASERRSGGWRSASKKAPGTAL